MKLQNNFHGTAIFNKLKWFSVSVVVCILLMPNDSSAWAKEECKGNAKSEYCKGSSNDNEEGWNISSCQLLKYGGALAGAAGGIAAAPAILGAMGFTAGGIAAGSLAAKLFSATAALHGGAVPAGSLVAFLQSAGAAGLGLTSKGVIGTVSAYLTSFLSSCEDVDVHINEQEFNEADMEELSVDDLCKIWDLIKELQKATQTGKEKSTAVGFGNSAVGFQGREEATAEHGAFSKFANLKPAEIDLLCTLWKKVNG